MACESVANLAPRRSNFFGMSRFRLSEAAFLAPSFTSLSHSSLPQTPLWPFTHSKGKLGPFFSLRDRPPFWRDPCFLSLSSHCPPTLGGVLLGPQSCTWSRWQLFVKAPPMVGPTWTRVRFTLGSDCLPTLSQGTALPWPHVSWSVYCSHARDSMIRVIQGCTSTSYSSMSPWGLFTTSYSVCLHGILYPMTDCYVYDWRRALKPASADALRVSLWFYYW